MCMANTISSSQKPLSRASIGRCDNLPPCLKSFSKVFSESHDPFGLSSYEVGGQRVSSATDSAERFSWVSRPRDISARSGSDRFQPPLPEPCRLLSEHTALQGGGSTGIGLLRHPPRPLGSVHPPLQPFTLSC